jgi:citrate synthase
MAAMSAGLYGFNHRLYPHGDPRTPVRNIERFLKRVKVEADATPGIAIVLTVLTPPSACFSHANESELS